jgi:hypothetical protein
MTPYHGLRRSRLDPVVVLAAFMAVLAFDALTSATSRNIFSRVWNDLVIHPSGPLGFRFWIQPAVAISLGIMDGHGDARAGRAENLWIALHEKSERRNRLIAGSAAISSVLLIGLAIDAAYQLVAFRTIYPFEALFVATLLAATPYFLVRIYAAWLARREMTATAKTREEKR